MKTVYRLAAGPLAAAVLLAAGEVVAAEVLVAPRACQHCGWIEAKRELTPAPAQPGTARVYEYTVRMSDGSTRVFPETLPASWRLRERLILIDGGPPVR